MSTPRRPIPTFHQRNDSEVWHFNVKFRGKRYRRTTKTTDRAKAERMADAFVSTIMSTALADGTLPGEMEASALFARYNKRLNSRGKPKHPATVRNYERYAERFAEKFGDPILGDIQRFQLEEWRDWLSAQNTAYGNGQRQHTLAPKTVKEHLEYVAAVCKTYGMPNPCRGVVRPQKDAIEQREDLLFYAPKEIKSLIVRAKNYAINEPDSSWGDFSAWLELMALTGMRMGEARGIRYKDIDWEESVLTVTSTKTRKPRPLNVEDDSGELGLWYLTYRIVLSSLARHFPDIHAEVIESDPSLDEIRERIGEALPRLPDTELTVYPYKKLWFYKKMKTLCKHCEVDFKGVHALRHAFASKAIRSPNWTIEYLAQWLGHEDISTTYRFYGHLLKEKRPAFSYD